MGELVDAARAVRRRPLHLERRVLLDLLARLRVPRHEPGHDQRLRLRPRHGETSLDEQDVETLLHAAAAAASGSRVPSERTLGRAITISVHAMLIEPAAISVSWTPISAATGPAIAAPSGISTNDPSAS